MWNSDSCKGVQVWGRTGPNHTHYPADWNRVKGKNLQQVPIKLRFVCIQTVAATSGQTGSGKSQQLQWFAIINSDFLRFPDSCHEIITIKAPASLCPCWVATSLHGTVPVFGNREHTAGFLTCRIAFAQLPWESEVWGGEYRICFDSAQQRS